MITDSVDPRRIAESFFSDGPSRSSGSLRVSAAGVLALLDIANAIRAFTEAYQRRTSLTSLGRR